MDDLALASSSEVCWVPPAILPAERDPPVFVAVARTLKNSLAGWPKARAANFELVPGHEMKFAARIALTPEGGMPLRVRARKG